MIKVMFGNEPYCIRLMKRKWEAGEDPVFRFDAFERDAFEALFSGGLFASRQKVYVDLERLSMLENPFFRRAAAADPECGDAFIYVRTVDRNAVFCKELRKMRAVEVREYNKIMDPERVRRIVVRYVQDKGRSLSKDVYDAVLERLNYYGNPAVGMYDVIGAIDALLALSHPRKEAADTGLVPLAAPDGELDRRFTLAPLLKAGNGRGAYHQLSLLKNESSMAILMLLMRELRVSYKVRLGCTLARIGAQKSWFGHLPEAVLVECMERISDIASRLRSGRVPAGQELYLAVNGMLAIMGKQSEEERRGK